MSEPTEEAPEPFGLGLFAIVCVIALVGIWIGLGLLGSETVHAEPAPIPCEWSGWQLVAPYSTAQACEGAGSMPWGTWTRDDAETGCQVLVYLPSGVDVSPCERVGRGF